MKLNFIDSVAIAIKALKRRGTMIRSYTPTNNLGVSNLAPESRQALDVTRTVSSPNGIDQRKVALKHVDAFDGWGLVDNLSAPLCCNSMSG